MSNILIPHWPAPKWVQAFTTTRQGGVSEGPFHSLNLANHVGDNPAHVAQNRIKFQRAANFLQPPAWLNQTHSTRVVNISAPLTQAPDADGSYTQRLGMPIVVMTADCLPLLLTDTAGTVVAAVHAGWKGLLNGVIENAVRAIAPIAQGDILAWLGPAISAKAFEVGDELREAFVAYDSQAAIAFKSYQTKWLADLYELAKQRLAQVEVTHIYGGEYCTYTDQERFFSYRRDGMTGRMVTAICLNTPPFKK